ncbi:MAG: hypothetical protein K8U57_15445 [Planctomycetes bacterium]|nr:hypothetical protein [Planctomycetota bacterium]
MDVVQIVGAGGIGCAVGYALRAAGVRVIFVERNPAKIAAGLRDGVRVDERSPLTAEFTPSDDWKPLPDVPVLLCTKCYDNHAVLAKLPHGVELIPIQNGFDPQLDAFGHTTEGCCRNRQRTASLRAGRPPIVLRVASGESSDSERRWHRTREGWAVSSGDRGVDSQAEVARGRDGEVLRAVSAGNLLLDGWRD